MEPPAAVLVVVHIEKREWKRKRTKRDENERQENEEDEEKTGEERSKAYGNSRSPQLPLITYARV